ncbi:MAG TPA: HAD family phosphatase [Anaeromyxobacteraceae bacterium]|nr:HAD family phosphatase [Anaeromyxobacteraceae bacterium]
MAGAEARKGAFFDVDGTLVRTNLVHAFAFYAMNQGSILGTAWQTLRTVASVPLFWATDKVNRKLFNELFYRYYQGQTEDRLVVLAEELFEEVLRPAIYPGTPRLLDEARRAGCRLVLCTGALDITMLPLVRHLGVDDLIANRMHFVDGVATGRVVPPIIEGAHKALVIRDYCVREGLKLEACHAYSDSFSDYPMLAVVGHPTAVNPDFRLRGVARAYEWPVISTEEG